MQRALGGADAAAEAAAAATVAPLLKLKLAARKAAHRLRCARAVELYERAVAAAEELAAQPRESLIVAALLDELHMTHSINLAQASDESALADANAMAAEAARLKVRVRSLGLLHARWQAGTLFAPTPEEAAYLVEDDFGGRKTGFIIRVNLAEFTIPYDRVGLLLYSP
jgi:hypothetical protein